MAAWQPLLMDVMRKRSHALIAYAGLFTGNTGEAEDVVQEALIRTFSRGRRFENAAAAESYVRRAIPSVFIDRGRSATSAWRAHTRAVDRAPHEVDIDAQVDVRRALAKLPPRERSCMVLRFFDDLTVPQIAARLGLSDGAVKRYLSDASKRIAAELSVEADWESAPALVPVVDTHAHKIRD
ncbi:MAG: sigma-70 family RNA polymerase sigma factor [Demequinaceae bacterium]|nr:sigma-70 family RNA polymerase sigma factor [Demequinaceae bacterium]